LTRVRRGPTETVKLTLIRSDELPVALALVGANAPVREGALPGLSALRARELLHDALLLAALGVARAAAMAGDPEHTRTSSERMMLWSETDSGLQAMNDAREELARLKATLLR
jgi:hypothetical protein